MMADGRAGWLGRLLGNALSSAKVCACVVYCAMLCYTVLDCTAQVHNGTATGDQTLQSIPHPHLPPQKTKCTGAPQGHTGERMGGSRGVRGGSGSRWGRGWPQTWAKAKAKTGRAGRMGPSGVSPACPCQFLGLVGAANLDVVGQAPSKGPSASTRSDSLMPVLASPKRRAITRHQTTYMRSRVTDTTGSAARRATASMGRPGRAKLACQRRPISQITNSKSPLALALSRSRALCHAHTLSLPWSYGSAKFRR